MSELDEYKKMFRMKQDDWLAACQEIDQLKADLAELERQFNFLDSANDKMIEEKNQLKAERDAYTAAVSEWSHRAALHRAEADAWRAEAERLAGVLKPFSGHDGYEEVNQALAEHEAFKEGKGCNHTPKFNRDECANCGKQIRAIWVLA